MEPHRLGRAPRAGLYPSKIGDTDGTYFELYVDQVDSISVQHTLPVCTILFPLEAGTHVGFSLANRGTHS